MSWFNRKKEIHFTDLDGETREEILEYIGKNSVYYEKKWNKLSKRKGHFTWNWAAFFLSFFWFAYRKMNIYAYSFLAFLAVIDVLSIIFFKHSTSNTSFGPAFLIIALSANKIYFDFALKQVNKLKTLYSDRNERLDIIRKRGGVSWLHAILFVIVMFTYSFSISVIEEKVYHSYMSPKFSKAVKLQESGKLDEAIQIYEEIENKDFPVPEIYFNEALIFNTNQEYDHALRQINTYLKLVPNSKSGEELKKKIINAKKAKQ